MKQEIKTAKVRRWQWRASLELSPFCSVGKYGKTRRAAVRNLKRSLMPETLKRLLG